MGAGGREVADVAAGDGGAVACKEIKLCTDWIKTKISAKQFTI